MEHTGDSPDGAPANASPMNPNLREREMFPELNEMRQPSVKPVSATPTAPLATPCFAGGNHYRICQPRSAWGAREPIALGF